ncbi:conserved hypothetical protein [Ricinus communis]|uniref:Uncharacterized protein n=1 Tax=Ricinus communis TaxID=3988 RepID=B9TA60_RICCO|nr:conserved hypothetical protein [Ricinus communis]
MQLPAERRRADHLFVDDAHRNRRPPNRVERKRAEAPRQIHDAEIRDHCIVRECLRENGFGVGRSIHRVEQRVCRQHALRQYLRRLDIGERLCGVARAAPQARVARTVVGVNDTACAHRKMIAAVEQATPQIDGR